MPTIFPPLKYHGGKHYLAQKIVALMPPRCNNPNAPTPDDPGWLHFVEPFFGGGQVLLANDPEGISEVANDINANLTNFWRVLQDVGDFERFCRIVEAAPFSECEWDDTSDRLGGPNPVDRAVAFFIRCRQSLAGRINSFAPLTRKRTRRGMNEQASAWLSAVDQLPSVHARLRQVVILNRDALDVIRQEDDSRTLFYCDPPYLHETRTATSVYHHEMTENQHREMLHLLLAVKGKVILSGYDSPLYAEALAHWTIHTFAKPNNAAGGSQKRRMTEVVWCNF